MGNIRLPPVLTAAVLRAVTDAVERCFAEWVAAEQRHAPPAVLAQLQATYEAANTTYQSAYERAVREGVVKS